MINEKSLIDDLSKCHPKIARGQVWCKKGGATKTGALKVWFASGWPTCCGDTMTIDSPEERKSK